MNDTTPATVFRGIAQTTMSSGSSGYLTQQEALQPGNGFDKQRDRLQSPDIPPMRAFSLRFHDYTP
jgi:hypothetical protein